MQKLLMFVSLAAVFAAIPYAWADEITVDGQTYTDVLVRESQSRYYVQLPDQGRVVSFPKVSVPEADVVFSTGQAERRALQDAWALANAELRGVASAKHATQPVASSLGHPETPSRDAAPGDIPPVIRSTVPDRGYDSPRSSGRVQHLNLKDVPVGHALKAMLRPLGLDYRVEEGYVWISTPERIRTESNDTPVTRHYLISQGAQDTLPKVVLANATGFQGTASYNGGASTTGGAASNAGNQGTIGNGTAGGGGGAAGVPQNISDLFFNIDDRLVGETPAVIGLQLVQGDTERRYREPGPQRVPGPTLRDRSQAGVQATVR